MSYYYRVGCSLIAECLPIVIILLHDIILRENLLDKLMSTPLATYDVFLSTDIPYSYPTYYPSLVRSL